MTDHWSVCHKYTMAEPIEVPFGLWTRVGPWKHVHAMWGSWSPMRRSNFRRKYTFSK